MMMIRMIVINSPIILGASICQFVWALPMGPQTGLQIRRSARP
jgi:hypothetical protein